MRHTTVIIHDFLIHVVYEYIKNERRGLSAHHRMVFHCTDLQKKRLCVTVNCCFAFYQVSLQEPQVS